MDVLSTSYLKWPVYILEAESSGGGWIDEPPVSSQYPGRQLARQEFNLIQEKNLGFTVNLMNRYVLD